MIPMLRFYNTLSGEVETFTPIRAGAVGLYTCGPTVYNFPHIGNWRAYVFEDLLKRFLAFSGFKVMHVMNITDVDDKTIREANARGLSLQDYTRPFVEGFFQDLRTLNIRPADHYPRATEHIPEMLALIKTLLDRGYAYEKEGSVYFSIAKFPAYGALSKIRLDELRPAQRSEADEYEKESVHDFALWKTRKEGEPFWESEFGPGRPGWHIECSAMSSIYLGPTFDIHCGGVDNIFPHHENEIAQSEAANGVKFVNTWLHCHHLVVDGEKMAKSKGNFFTMGDLVARGEDPLAIRYLLLSTHYRKMLNFTFDALAQARASRQRLLDFCYELDHLPAAEAAPNEDLSRLMETARQGFIAGLEDDLNIALSLSALFEFIKGTNVLLSRNGLGRGDAGRVLAFIRSLDEVLAILPPAQGDADLSPEITGLIEERERARRERDFQKADRLRQDILLKGVLLEDTKDGVRWKKVKPPQA